MILDARTVGRELSRNRHTSAIRSGPAGIQVGGRADGWMDGSRRRSQERSWPIVRTFREDQLGDWAGATLKATGCRIGRDGDRSELG